MKKLKQWKAKLTVRNCELLIGLFILGKGTWLLHDSHYFIYPPQFENIENSRYIDCTLILLGILLMLSAFCVPYINNTKYKIMLIVASKVFLVMVGIVCMILALLQLTHGIFTPYYRMGHSAWGDLIIFGFVYLTACDAWNGVSLVNWGYIITAIGGVISAITLFYKAFDSSKQQSLTTLLQQKDEEIKQKAQDAEIYRKKWLDAEKDNDELRKKLKNGD